MAGTQKVTIPQVQPDSIKAALAEYDMAKTPELLLGFHEEFKRRQPEIARLIESTFHNAVYQQENGASSYHKLCSYAIMVPMAVARAIELQTLASGVVPAEPTQ